MITIRRILNIIVFTYVFSHRPVEVHNIYNQVQVKLLMREDEFDKIPRFEEVFRDDVSYYLILWSSFEADYSKKIAELKS